MSHRERYEAGKGGRARDVRDDYIDELRAKLAEYSVVMGPNWNANEQKTSEILCTECGLPISECTQRALDRIEQAASCPMIEDRPCHDPACETDCQRPYEQRTNPPRHEIEAMANERAAEQKTSREDPR